MKNNELYHWGVLGMKWGVRRRRARALAKARRTRKKNLKMKRKLEKEELKKAKTKPKSSLSDISNEDLQKKIDRLVMEQRYLELSSSIKNMTATKKTENRGRKLVTDIIYKGLENAGPKIISYATIQAFNKTTGAKISAADKKK